MSSTSSKKTECGCLLAILPCTQTLDAEERTSQQIDKEIAKEKEYYSKTHRLLLLGAGESGKSTIIQQMLLIHSPPNALDESWRKRRIGNIRDNVLEAIVCIISAMPNLNPPVELEATENQYKVEWILEKSKRPNFDFSQEFYDFADALWKDPGVQLAFKRSNEYQLLDSAKYYLDRIDEIRKDDYIPSEPDYMRCRICTTRIQEVSFVTNNVYFRLIDVGGQRGERRKWFFCFNDVTAIIFVSGCSSYNMVLREDSSKNRLRESLELFKIVWNNRWLAHVSVILFLNKQDLFREKILSGYSKLEDYFPEYKDFHKTVHEANENEEVDRAKHFIKNEFEKITLMSEHHADHRFYPHFTCAIDTENIRRVFEDCRDSIQRRYLIDYDLI